MGRSSLVAACILLAAGVVTSAAAPNIPSSELPGRERQRFLESPVDRFTQPQKNAKPLWHWDCEKQKTQKGKKSGQHSGRC